MGPPTLKPKLFWWSRGRGRFGLPLASRPAALLVKLLALKASLRWYS
jgi:hypothetical protein